MKTKILGILVIMLLIATALTSAATTMNNENVNKNHNGKDISNIEPPEVEWMNVFGGWGYDSGSCVQQTSDGGYIIGGYSESLGEDNYLIKTDSDGNEEWAKTVGSEDGARCNHVQQTDDGGYILFGWCDVFGYGNEGYWIKTDSNGNVDIEAVAPGYNSLDRINYGQQTEDGGYIAVGSADPPGVGEKQIWLIKKNANLETEWEQFYGGTGQDKGYSVKQTTDGGYIITGYVDWGDFCMIKTDENGEIEWDKYYGDRYMDVGYDVLQTTDGGYIFVGIASDYSPTDSTDMYVVKTDESGNFEWEKFFDDGNNIEEAYSVCQTYDGGYFICGELHLWIEGETFIWVIKLDSNGDFEWDMVFGETGEEDDVSLASSCQQTSDGGYIIAGRTNRFGADGIDVWLCKLETQNNPPNKPIIDGPTNGNPGTEYTYTITATDPDGGDMHYVINWDDGTGDEWIGPFDSGHTAIVKHTWTEEGTYVVRAAAEDLFDMLGEWATLEVVMPVNQQVELHPLFQRILERFPNAFPILRHLMGLYD